MANPFPTQLDRSVLGDHPALPPEMPQGLFRHADGLIRDVADSHYLPFETIAANVVSRVSALIAGRQTVDLNGRWATPRPLTIVQIGVVDEGRAGIEAVTGGVPAGTVAGASVIALADYRRTLAKPDSGGAQSLVFLGRRMPPTLDIPDGRAAELADMFGRIASLPTRRMPLDADARTTFSAWLEQRAAQPAENAVADERMAALPMSAIKLAVAMEILWWAAESGTQPPTEISEDAVLVAIGLIEGFFVPHLRHILREHGMCGRDSGAKTLAHWLISSRVTSFNKRAVRREAGLPGLGDAKAMDAAVEELVAAGWLRHSRRAGPGKQPGNFDVNPALAGETLP